MASTSSRKNLKSEVAQGADAETEGEIKEGYVIDFISGTPVRAAQGSEELEAVQVFSRRLVEELGYKRGQIQTRPQFKVRASPSDEGQKRGYPVDICVFRSNAKLEDESYILVECKKPTRKDGEKQLKIYLTLSSAVIGVWFNGKQHIYLYKHLKANGEIEWKELRTLPRANQTIGDIGNIYKSELVLPATLKATFKDIRNHLAGNTKGITRDQGLALEIMNILFCKIYDEQDKGPDDKMEFFAKTDEKPVETKRRISKLFEDVKAKYKDVFKSSDSIDLDAPSAAYVVGEIQNYLISRAPRDAIGEAFEVFIGPAVRGEEGQFFTPRNVVQMVIDIIDPKANETVIDPACGSGGFLVVALEHVWTNLEKEAGRRKWDAEQLRHKKEQAAQNLIRGLDKDAFLAKLTKAYMALIGDGRSGIFCEDSLDDPQEWSEKAQEAIKLHSFDIIITNPPFGSKIPVTGAHKLAQYDLGYRWSLARDEDADWVKSDKLHEDQPPQVLFIERCIQLLKPGGRMAVVLPESIFGMPVYGYIVKWLHDNFKLRAFISLPEEIFQPYTHAKTCVVILENTKPSSTDSIEMAIADWCGHDSRGNPTLRADSEGKLVLLDDLPKIAAAMKTRVIWQ